MLPASFQAPAAIILLIGGLLACFGGEQSTLMMVGAAIGGGLVGALLLIAAYFIGVALIGAGIGAMAANLLWAALGREPHIAVVIVLAVIGALAALSLQRYVIIIATAFGGA